MTWIVLNNLGDMVNADHVHALQTQETLGGVRRLKAITTPHAGGFDVEVPEGEHGVELALRSIRGQIAAGYEIITPKLDPDLIVPDDRYNDVEEIQVGGDRL